MDIGPIRLLKNEASSSDSKESSDPKFIPDGPKTTQFLDIHLVSICTKCNHAVSILGHTDEECIVTQVMGS